MATAREQYMRDGYVKVEGLLDREEIETIRRETAEICAGHRGRIEGVEPLANGTPVDDSVCARYLCIHFPHKISPLMAGVLGHKKITAVLADLIGPNVKCMQSMLFMKNAGKPGQAWHQDEFYIPTRDRSLCGVWIALDRATRENGCLWVIPGSQTPGVIWPMKTHNSDEFDAGQMSYGWPYDPERDGVICEVDAGGVLFFNGHLLHCSCRNRAAGGFRRALVNHYMSAESMLPWDWDGRLSMKSDMRDIVLVAGTDPYAHKGIENLTYPFLRKEK
jgi:ectoine hydroxylase-related dioxygenase (phytanoyl-CoA dioxygenase family)